MVQLPSGISRRGPASASSLGRATQGLGYSHQPWPSKVPCRLPAWVRPTGQEAKSLRGNRDMLQAYCGPRTQPSPKPLWPVWKSGRRQEPVPGDMSLAPAGGGGAGGSRLLRTVLSDSWSRREDWQGRDVIVDGKGGGRRGGKDERGCRFAATVAMGRGWRRHSSSPSERRGPHGHPQLPPSPKNLIPQRNSVRAPWKQ